jgi:hypothetical protein
MHEMAFVVTQIKYEASHVANHSLAIARLKHITV